MFVLTVIFFLFFVYIIVFRERGNDQKHNGGNVTQACFNRFSGISEEEVLQCPAGFEKNPENGAQNQHINSDKACRKIKAGVNPDFFYPEDYCSAHLCPEFLLNKSNNEKEKRINPNLLKTSSTTPSI